MSNDIYFNGVGTNNLKEIDVELKKGAINLIVGPSGSGKSSLAYNTIAQIGQHEFMSMYADNVLEPTYKVKSFSNVVATIPIRQTNQNNNPRSTIGTYFGYSRNIGLIYANYFGVTEDLFVLNNENNLCPKCHGLGTVRAIDANKIIDYNVPLEKNPIKCWNRNKDFYGQILCLYCRDCAIDTKKTFRELTQTEREKILCGESKKKYTIRYKKTNTYSSRTTKFYGVMTEKLMLPNKPVSKKFYSEKICPYCNGLKYSRNLDKYKIFGLSVGEFMCTPFVKLNQIIDQIASKLDISQLSFTIETLKTFITKANELNLGHLFFHRSIPTLSGGELQRLRMVQIFNTQLSGLLIVLDEPLAGLSGEEKESIFRNIVGLIDRHTVLVVDHSDKFVDVSSQIIALGEGGGVYGGSIIDANKYLEVQREVKSFNPSQIKSETHLFVNNKIYHYVGADISIADDCLNLLRGDSGVGKSTLLREYLPQCICHYGYISQKPLMYNSNSYVATSLGISTIISDLFAKKFSRNRGFFSNLTGSEGVCPICQGAGYIQYGNSSDSAIRIQCHECLGTGFNKNLRNYKIDGKSIFDIWKMTISEAISFFMGKDNTIVNKLRKACKVLLDYLIIGQPTSTLSGGENVRIKILRDSFSHTKVLGIDEPFKGLNSQEIYKLIGYLDCLRKNKKTIIIADHSEGIDYYFSKKILIVNEEGVLKGI